MDRESATAGNQRARRPGRAVATFHTLALVGAGGVVWASSSLDRWQLAPLLILGAFTIISVLTDVATGASKVRVSGVMVGLITAIVLLGPGPAAALGAITIATSRLRTRAAWHFALTNVVIFTWFPLTAGIFFHAAVRVA